MTSTPPHAYKVERVGDEFEARCFLCRWESTGFEDYDAADAAGDEHFADPGDEFMTAKPPVCHNPSCPISLFEHVEGHGECVPAPAPTALPGAVIQSPETWFMVGPNGSVLQGSTNGWVPVHTSVLEKHLTDTSSGEGWRS